MAEAVSELVRAFYEELPFNMFSDVEAQTRFIQERDVIREQFPVLVPHLSFGRSVLDVGCGTGWLANNVQRRFPCRVTGLDFNPVAIERARETAAGANLKTRFIVSDVFEFVPEASFDVVLSFGALHHTRDCQAAVRHVLEKCLSAGGIALIGLYHHYGRAPFLNHFRDMRSRGVAEDDMLRAFIHLHTAIADDEVLARSWFRDQVLHPHETQHTLEEMSEVVSAVGGRIIACSVNGFNPIDDPQSLFAAERDLGREGEAALRAGRYYPGFFYFLAEMPPA